jgi:beta-galactosidase
MTESVSPLPKLHIGSAWYPEHWSEERWAEDVRLMKAAGLTVARLAEFAWSTLEPAEGDFHFDWLDRAIQLLAESGLQTVLGTPTAAPPAWLCSQFPDLMTMEATGLRAQFGNRCHYCVTSPDLFAATTRLVGAMAEHFGPNPQVIGWQIDNEFSRVCYCPRCQTAFQQFLRAQYGTLEYLNARWSTAYWSQTYSDWSQIPIPIGGHNPGLMLEFNRFITRSYRTFQKLQIDLLRPQLQPSVWITHNFMGWFDGLDHYAMSEDLDMVSWDWYIGSGHNQFPSTTATHDLTRGFKRKNFWVMETQPGNVNWSAKNNTLNKGEGRAMAWQAVARGAEGLLYWQWRSALGGQEQLHGTLVDASGQPRPFYNEVQQIAAEFERMSPLLAGSRVSARVAILNDYESRWSTQWQPHHKDFSYVEHLLSYARSLNSLNISTDIISADAPLLGYRVVIVPGLTILDEARAQKIIQFAESGGIVLLGARTGLKDRSNALLPSRQPGLLRELAGVEVLDFYALDEDVPVKGNWFTGVSKWWAESLNIRENSNTVIIAKYGPSNGWLDDQPAITVRGIRTGLVYYVGCLLDETAQAAFMARFAQNSGVREQFLTPAGVQILHRISKDNTNYHILINHTRTAQDVNLPWPAFDHLDQRQHTTLLSMPPYGVSILTKQLAG